MFVAITNETKLNKEITDEQKKKLLRKEYSSYFPMFNTVHTCEFRT